MKNHLFHWKALQISKSSLWAKKRKLGTVILIKVTPKSNTTAVRRQGGDSTAPTSFCIGGMLGEQNSNGKLQKNKQENRKLSRKENRKEKELNKVN